MIYVAGQPITPQQAFARLANYPPNTVQKYDLPRCMPGLVTLTEARRTRVINSRISGTEAQWFIQHSQSWHWTLIPATASLVNADPTVVGGLYDDAAHLYGHFANTAPRGVARGKISKVLHLKYPGLIPILDSRLTKLYRGPATAAAQASPRWRGRFRRLWWQAIRQDLLASDFVPLRRLLAGANDHRRTFAQLSDLRLHDALCW